MIIDTHCHFDLMHSPETYIKKIEEEGNITIGMSNLPSHFILGRPHVLALKNVRMALGFHPLFVADNQQQIRLFEEQFDNTSYIGEIGLDFSKEGYKSKDIQIEIISRILSNLKGRNKIISVHSHRAERELLILLKKYEIKNVIFHWYSGPVNLIEDMVSCGYYFSINEAMTLSPNGKKIIQKIPKSRILTETDAPYNTRCSIPNAITNIGINEKQIEENFTGLIQKITLCRS